MTSYEIRQLKTVKATINIIAHWLFFSPHNLHSSDNINNFLFLGNWHDVMSCHENIPRGCQKQQQKKIPWLPIAKTFNRWLLISKQNNRRLAIASNGSPWQAGNSSTKNVISMVILGIKYMIFLMWMLFGVSLLFCAIVLASRFSFRFVHHITKYFLEISKWKL